MVKCVVPISGGKDSQACLKLALEHFAPNEVRGLFCDTMFEHPITYQHVERLKTLYGEVRIDRVCAGDVLGKSVKYRRFPGGGSRHCTDELKIQPTKNYCRELAKELGHGFEVWYGMRTGESNERETRYKGKVCDELYPPHQVLPSKYPKYLAKAGVMFRLAILDWSTDEVMTFLEGNHNPLYDAGFPRVGCFPCLASGDKWKERAFAYDDFGQRQKIAVLDISGLIGKSIWTSKGGKARNEGPDCSLMCGD